MNIQSYTSGLQSILKQNNIDAWLLYSFHGLNPIAEELTGIQSATRRWFLLLNQKGEYQFLIHTIEQGVFKPLGIPSSTYSSFRDLQQQLQALLSSTKTVAIEYSPNCEIPYVSKVDAGTVEMIRETGVNIVSSAELVQHTLSTWAGQKGAESHKRVLKVLHTALEKAYQTIQKDFQSNGKSNEYTIQQVIMEVFKKYNLETCHPPVVAGGKNSADPHYCPTKSKNSDILPDQVLMIDLWAKEKQSDAIYADITWMGYTADIVPEKVQKVWETVRNARDTGIEFLRENISHRDIQGWEVDDQVREVIEHAGFGESFTHRTGHSIQCDLHGKGVNIDNFELHDTRTIIPDCGFSIEPGVYIPEEFGVRSEVDVYITSEKTVRIFDTPQQELLSLHNFSSLSSL